jgi:hypothetical protein
MGKKVKYPNLVTSIKGDKKIIEKIIERVTEYKKINMSNKITKSGFIKEGKTSVTIKAGIKNKIDKRG